MVKRSLFLATIVGVLAAAQEARAFCRTTTCAASPSYQPVGSACEPDGWAKQCASMGNPDALLWWKTGCVGFSMQKDASRKVSYDEALAATSAAFSAWTSATCAGAAQGEGGATTVSIAAVNNGPAACSVAGYNQDGPNQHVIAFHDTVWPYDAVEGVPAGERSLTIALTTVHFDSDTGELYDADIEINSADYDVVPTDAPGANTVDLQVVLTHEAGHFLGLAHSPDSNAVMYAQDEGADLRKRILSADDVAAICSVYPPSGLRTVSYSVASSGAVAEGSCDATPRHGFTSGCSTPASSSSGCAIGSWSAAGSSAAGAAWTCALGALAIGVARRRHRKSRGVATCYGLRMWGLRRRVLTRVFPVLLGLGAAAAPALLAAHDAHASISIAVTFDSLLSSSSSAVVVIPAEQRALWEDGRIYTYTRVLIDRAVAGDLEAGSEAWVRTMGGIVGKVGQRVEGEAVFVMGRPSLVFLHPGPVGAFDVTARGQGQFPVVLDDQKSVRVMKSSAAGALLAPRALPVAEGGTQPPPKVLAATAIHGRLLDEVTRDVATSWARVHGR